MTDHPPTAASPTHEALYRAYRQARKVVVFIVGSTVILVGLVLVFIPGPAMVVIPAGLAILATEFAFARRWLRRLKEQALQAARLATGGRIGGR